MVNPKNGVTMNEGDSLECFAMTVSGMLLCSIGVKVGCMGAHACMCLSVWLLHGLTCALIFEEEKSPIKSRSTRSSIAMTASASAPPALDLETDKSVSAAPRGDVAEPIVAKGAAEFPSLWPDVMPTLEKFTEVVVSMVCSMGAGVSAFGIIVALAWSSSSLRSVGVLHGRQRGCDW